MFYIILAILIICLSQININEKYFSLINTLIYSSYVAIAFLLLSGYFVEEVRFFFRGIFDYFEWHLDYADDRMSERNFKNLDLVYYIAYAYSLSIFLIKLITNGVELEETTFSFKKKLAGLLVFISSLYLSYWLFELLSSMAPVDLERVSNMTTYRLGLVSNKVGIVLTSFGMIAIAAMCGVYIKLSITMIRKTLKGHFFNLIKGVNK